jgi:hypothetical protein
MELIKREFAKNNILNYGRVNLTTYFYQQKFIISRYLFIYITKFSGIDNKTDINYNIL